MIIGETPREQKEREGVESEVWCRSMRSREWLDQFVTMPPLPADVLNRLPRCMMGYPPRSLPKSDKLTYKLDEATKKLTKECNDIQIATRRKAGAKWD